MKGLQQWDTTHFFLVWLSIRTFLNLASKAVQSGDQHRGTTNEWTGEIYLRPSGFPRSDDEPVSVLKTTTTEVTQFTLKELKETNLPGLHCLCLKHSGHLLPLCTLMGKRCSQSVKTQQQNSYKAQSLDTVSACKRRGFSVSRWPSLAHHLHFALRVKISRRGDFFESDMALVINLPVFIDTKTMS